ncbi:hypothetical protein Tco_0069524, partial [Tanacetum coccineum]
SPLSKQRSYPSKVSNRDERLTTQTIGVSMLKEDEFRSHHWKVVQDVNHQKILDRDIIADDAVVIHDNISYDLALINMRDM